MVGENNTDGLKKIDMALPRYQESITDAFPIYFHENTPSMPPFAFEVYL